MFKVRRMDADLLVISNKYLPELRRLPESVISIKLATLKVSAIAREQMRYYL